MKNFDCKKKISQAILTGAVVMLFVFAISLFLPKEWLVSGKIVVFPSGQPTGASATISQETGNTAEVIKSAAFQKNLFADQAANLPADEAGFAGARVLKNTSMVWVKFRSSESDIQTYEDLIVKIPSQVSQYQRDLYEGTPFKYRMISDPEISASPVRPNLLLNAILGFLGGIVLYLLYWYAFGSKQLMISGAENEMGKSAIISPEIKATEPALPAGKPSEKKVGGGKVVLKDGKPHFVPGKKESAPENLPFVDETISDVPSNIQEPSDDEVKDRLNRLMRGEL